ncbi:hypothetical protein ACFL5O_08620 [Myxococcota bacterium]
MRCLSLPVWGLGLWWMGACASPEVLDPRTIGTVGSATSTALEPTSPLASGAASAQRDGVVLGTVQLREQALVIGAGQDGPRFDVRDSAGRRLAFNLSERQLAERFDALHRFYRSAVARSQGDKAMDARLDSGWQRGGSSVTPTTGRSAPPGAASPNRANAEWP